MPEHPIVPNSPLVYSSIATVTKKANIAQLEGGKKPKHNKPKSKTGRQNIHILKETDHSDDHKGTREQHCCVRSLVDLLLKIHTADF